MKIGILQTGHVVEELAGRHGDYAGMFRRMLGGRGFDFLTWNVIDGDFPQSPYDADGWLVTGSKFSVCDDHPWIRRLEDFLRRCCAEGPPVVGICFGHQALAKALGGTVEQAEQGWGVGRSRYDTGDGPLFLNAWHQDQVTKLPPGADVIGTSPFCRFAILAYGDRALSYQPHPEFSGEFLADLIEARGVGLVPDTLLDRARADIGKKTAGERVAASIEAFFHGARKENQAAA